MRPDLRRRIDDLVVRAQAGDLSAFNEFAFILESLERLLPQLGRSPEWKKAAHDWVRSKLIEIGRPDFQAPPDIISSFLDGMVDVAAWLEAAEDLQTRVTTAFTEFDAGVDIGIACRAKAWLSGDFADVVPGNGRIWLVLGDARGHGLPAWHYAATVYATLRCCFSPGLSLNRSLRRANEILHRHRPGPEYAAVQVAAWNPASKRFRLANAGATVRPIIVSEGKATAIEIGGWGLGLRPESGYETREFKMGPGDLLVLASDGIVDQEDAMEEPYGPDRLRDFVQNNSSLDPQDLAERILDDVSRYGYHKPGDDQTVMVVRFRSSAEELPIAPTAGRGAF